VLALAPASAPAVTVGVGYAPFAATTAYVSSESGESARLTIAAHGAVPGTVGSSEIVVTSEAGPLHTWPPCIAVATRTVRCGDTGGLAGMGPITALDVKLYWGNNRVEVSPTSDPLLESFLGSPGNDVVLAGPVAGSPRYKADFLWTGLGGGKDRIEWGPRPVVTDVFAVRLEDGDDTAVDGDDIQGLIECGAGNDRTVGADEDEVYDCERNVSTAP
jgi:hypothetical protein